MQAIKEVIEMYPQDCLGCAVYNIVKWSYVLKQQQIGVQLLSEILMCNDMDKAVKYYQ